MKAFTQYVSVISALVFLLIAVPDIQPATAQVKHAHENNATNSPVIQSSKNLPPGLVPAVARSLQANLPAPYQLKKTGDDFHAANPSHRMQFTFTPEGPMIQSSKDSWKWAMILKRWGYEGSLQPVPVAQRNVNNGRMEYRRGSILTEWYVNTTFGMEQGFTLHRRPPNNVNSKSMVVLEMTLSGNLSPKLQGKSLLLQDTQSRTVTRYTGLHAYDADERTLPAHLELAGNTLRILVNDRTARYPIVVDPWVQAAKLTSSFDWNYLDLGKSIAVDRDTVVVGAPGDYIAGGSINSGAAYVFVKSGNRWADATETTKLIPSDGAAMDLFGCAVAISGDYIIVGAEKHDAGASDTNEGAAYIFVKPVTGWSGATTTETAKLTHAKVHPSENLEGDWFGCSVAITNTIAVVGAEWHDNYPDVPEPVYEVPDSGAVYVFKRPKDGWPATATQTNKLTVDILDWGADDHLGASVAISNDTIVAGAPQQDYSAGAAYIYERPAVALGWGAPGYERMTQDAELTASYSESESGARFGYSVGISGDTIVIGADGKDGATGDEGAAYIFEKPVTGWADATEDAKLTAGDAANTDYFGCSVSISGDTVVVGARLDDDKGDGSGSAYVFMKPAGGWADMTQTAKLTAKDGSAGDYFGVSVAISGDTIAAGAESANVGTKTPGAAYVFGPPDFSPGVFLLLIL